MTVAELVQAARVWGWRIAVAESCTGGMLAASLTEVAGASDIFDRGFVTYSNAAKVEMLGVQVETLDTHGAVSEPVAREMARGALAHADASLAVAITGIAGPGGSDHKPEGRVCFAVAQDGRPLISETVEFGAIGRSGVRKAACDHALALLSRAIVP